MHSCFELGQIKDFRTEHRNSQDWPDGKPLPRVLSQVRRAMWSRSIPGNRSRYG
jgi:hypothetical protein